MHLATMSPLRTALAPCVRPQHNSLQRQVCLAFSSQPSLGPSLPVKQYSTTRSGSLTHRPSITAQRRLPFVPCRASSATFATSCSLLNTATADSPAPTASSTASKPSSTPALPWNDFFRLRQRRRYLNLGSSLVTASTAVFAGLGYVSSQPLESMQFFGMDPMVSVGLCVVASGVSGWLLGPLLGTAMFRVVYARRRGDFGAKERDFYARIKKYRVDPSSSSVQNPVPDYYGEKITSVAGYRQWLKDQRAFNRKRLSFVGT